MGHIYEDDGETTAYMGGAYRKTGYHVRYLAGENAFAVTMSATEDAFPPGTGMPAPDPEVTFLTFRADAGREYTVKF